MLSSLLALSILLAVSGGVMAAVTTEECLRQGSNLTVPDTATTCPDTSTAGSATTLTDFIANALNILSIVVGVIAVIMIIVGGFRYVASAGKAESIQGAKNTILYALIGLVVVGLAQVVVRFILQRTTTI